METEKDFQFLCVIVVLLFKRKLSFIQDKMMEVNQIFLKIVVFKLVAQCYQNSGI